MDHTGLSSRTANHQPGDGFAPGLSDTKNFEEAVFYYERAENLEEYEADTKLRHAQWLEGQGKCTETLLLPCRAQELRPRKHVQRCPEQVDRVAMSR